MGIIRTRFQAGFSLVELSIVMVIVGILVAGALQAYTIYDEKSKIERMDMRMTRVDNALKAYYDDNGELPCPAPVNSQAAGNDFDNQDCSITPVNGVLIGKIPAEDLKLTNDFMRDIYGRYATYAVTQDLTDGSGTTGAIQLRRKSTKVDVGLTEDTTLTEVDYVVLSAGKSGAGAFAFDGTVTCPASGEERINCDGNAVFMASDHSHADGNTYYDDIVKFNDEVESPAPKALKRAVRGEDFTHENAHAYRYDHETDSGNSHWVDVNADHYTMNDDTKMEVYLDDSSGESRSRTMYSLDEGDVVTVTPRSTSFSSRTEVSVNGEVVSTGSNTAPPPSSIPTDDGEYLYMNKASSGPEKQDAGGRQISDSRDSDPETIGTTRIYFWKE